MKQYLTPMLILLAAIVLVAVVQWGTPTPTDWTENYYSQDPRPYGAKLLVARLPDIFPNQQINTPKVSLYKRKDQVRPGNYLFVNNDFFLGDLDLNVLLALVSEGSNAFIAAAQLTRTLRDTLQIKSESVFNAVPSVNINFLPQTRQKAKNYEYKHIDYLYGLLPDSATTLRPVRLGTIVMKNLKGKADSATNFVAIRWGKGRFFIHTMPQVFSNYNMVDPENARYIAKALSYMPVGELFWEEYYTDATYASTRANDYSDDLPETDSLQTSEKPTGENWDESRAYPMRKNDRARENDSIFRFLLSEAALRWALYLTLGGLVLFVFFEAKRRQRIVPIIPPLANASLEFTETVGRLYYQHRDNKNIAEKKITYFLELIRNRFYLNTNKMDHDFYTALARKSGFERAEIESTFRFIAYIQKQGVITEEQLLDLNRRIGQFERKTA